MGFRRYLERQFFEGNRARAGTVTIDNFCGERRKCTVKVLRRFHHQDATALRINPHCRKNPWAEHLFTICTYHQFHTGDTHRCQGAYGYRGITGHCVDHCIVIDTKDFRACFDGRPCQFAAMSANAQLQAGALSRLYYVLQGSWIPEQGHSNPIQRAFENFM